MTIGHRAHAKIQFALRPRGDSMCFAIFRIFKPSKIILILLGFNWDFFYIMLGYTSLTTRNFRTFGSIFLELKFIENPGSYNVKYFTIPLSIPLSAMHLKIKGSNSNFYYIFVIYIS